MNASVRDLKSRLSRYLRQVQRGETVVVTLRGKPIARLVPLPSLPVGRAAGHLAGDQCRDGGKTERCHAPRAR